MREMVSAAAAKWKESPYVCHEARHVVYVTGQGDLFYRLVQCLKLNSQRQKLPCFLEMKPEKTSYVRQVCPQGYDQSEWLKSRWILNYFAAWQGRTVGDKLISSWVDYDGTESKVADLPVQQMNGRFLTREMLIGIRGYVQWQEGQPGFDRVDFPIDIPTRNLEISVIVDKELYRHMQLTTETEIPNLEVEFRNREAARFSGKEVALYPENVMTELYGRSSNDAGARQALSDLRDLKGRVNALLDEEADNGPVVTSSEVSLLQPVAR